MAVVPSDHVASMAVHEWMRPACSSSEVTWSVAASSKRPRWMVQKAGSDWFVYLFSWMLRDNVIFVLVCFLV